jgi:hypothetical protein
MVTNAELLRLVEVMHSQKEQNQEDNKLATAAAEQARLSYAQTRQLLLDLR